LYALSVMLKIVVIEEKMNTAISWIVGHVSVSGGVCLILTEPGSSSQTEPNGDTQAVAFRGVLTKILEKDRREKRKMEAVRGTLKLHRGFFTARTLVEAINNAGFCSVTERDVSHPLWRLHKLGEIGILQKGSGRRPTVYFTAEIQ